MNPGSEGLPLSLASIGLLPPGDVMSNQRKPVRQSTSKARSAASLRPLGRSESAGPRLVGRELGGRASTVVPSRREEEGGDSVLSRYFREMATHQVMGADEELQAAERVEKTEVVMWQKLLAYMPAARYLVPQLIAQVEHLPEEDRPAAEVLSGLLDVVRSFEKAGAVSERQRDDYLELCARLGRELRMPDADRVWMSTAAQT